MAEPSAPTPAHADQFAAADFSSARQDSLGRRHVVAGRPPHGRHVEQVGHVHGIGEEGKASAHARCRRRPGEPARLAQPIENTQVWNKELDSSNSYWTFNVYNAGDQFQATGAERSKNPGIDIAKPGGSMPGGDVFAVAKTNFALASNGGVASASSGSQIVGRIS